MTPKQISKIVTALNAARLGMPGSFLVFDSEGEGGASYQGGSYPTMSQGDVAIPVSNKKMTRRYVEQYL